MIAVGRAIADLGRARALVPPTWPGRFQDGSSRQQSVAVAVDLLRDADVRVVPNRGPECRLIPPEAPRMRQPSFVPSATQGLALIGPAKRGSPEALRDNTEGLVDGLFE